MLGEFEVQETVVLGDRNLFALVGVIVRGTAMEGMHARLGEGDEGFDERIHGVEFVDAAADSPDGSRPALTFSYSREEKLRRWQEIEWPGRRLRLTWEREGT